MVVVKKRPYKHHIAGLIGTAVLGVIILCMLGFLAWSYLARKQSPLIPAESKKLDVQDLPTTAQ